MHARIGVEKYKDILSQIRKGDYLLMKSSSTKGVKHTTSFTKLKAIGRVTRVLNYYTFSVEWFDDNKLPKDFDGIWYSKTVEKLRDDSMFEYARQFIKNLK